MRRRKIDQARNPNIPLQTAGLDQLTQRLRTHYQAIETLNATVDLEPSVLSTAKGEISEYKDVRGYILFRKPAWIRVIGLYPVVRATAFDMVSDGQSFRLFLPAKDLFLIGPNRVDQPSPRKLENLRPQHLLDALLAPPPEPSTEQAVLENRTDTNTASYIVHIIRHEKGGRALLTRNVWFDRASLTIERQQVFDERGDVVTDTRYRDWERHGGTLFPKEIRILRPKDEYELSIRFQKTLFNAPLEDQKFELPTPSGVKVQRIGEPPGKQATGGKSGG